MNKLFIHISLSSLIILAACSKSDEKEPEFTKTEADIAYTAFGEGTEMNIPDIEQATFNPVALHISGDTLFVANNHTNKQAVYLIKISENKLIGTIDTWSVGNEVKSFSIIQDIAVSDNLIFVGVQTSNIYVFDRKNLNYVNMLGDKNGNYNEGIYGLLHCYGMKVSGDKLIVRDKNSIRAYWIPEIISEPASRIPWIGKLKVEGLGYDYYPTMHGLAEYRDKMYITDWYSKTIQVIKPAKFEIIFGEETHPEAETTFKLEKLQPVGATVIGGKLTISTQNSPYLLRLDMGSGAVSDTIASFTGRTIGRMQLSNGSLYCIDLKNKRVIAAKGVTSK